MGLMFTLIGIAYLALRACGVQQATRDLQPIAFANRYGLTRREEELLCLLVAGRTNREIGEELTISIGTVKTHVHHIYEKVGVSSRERKRSGRNPPNRPSTATACDPYRGSVPALTPEVSGK